MSTASPVRPFIEACYGRPTERIPLWLMRQAGRYLPEYREIRAETSFEDLCRTPELAAEVTLQPIRRFDFDAAITFSDILVVSDAMGCESRFPTGGPKIDEPVRTAADVERLTCPDPNDALDFVMNTQRIVRRELPDTTALIGFAGGPLTVASYMVEGGSSKTFSLLKGLLFSDREAADALLGKLVEVTAGYLRAQIEAGCDAVQVFDTWASVLGHGDFNEIYRPHLIDLFERLKDIDAPKIYFAKGASHLYRSLGPLGADVLGVDWTVSIDEARALIDPEVPHPVQGNLDPVLLLGDEATLRRRTRSLIDAVSERRGWIFNLGHGVIKETPPENVAALVDEVRRGS